MSVIPREPCSETLFRLRNMYSRSIQNNNTISTVNFLNSDVNCLMIMPPKLLGMVNVFVIITLYHLSGNVEF